MPDIRSFFGGRPAPAPPTSQEQPAKRKSGKRKVIDDSDDEDVAATKKKTPEKPKKVKKESPKGQDTTASDYFGSASKSKPSRSTPTKSRASNANTNSASTTKTPPSQGTPRTQKTAQNVSPHTSRGRTSSRKKKSFNYAEDEIDDADFANTDAMDEGDDIFKAELKNGGSRQDDDYQEEDDDIDVNPSRKVSSKAKLAKASEEKNVGMLDLDDSEDGFAPPLPKDKTGAKSRVNGQKAAKATGAKARKLDEFDDAPTKPSPAKKRATKKDPAASKAEPVETSKEIDDILHNIPTVRPPTPPPKSDEPVKFKFQGHAQRAVPPPGAGTKEIPLGAENCLAGQTFVFTGILDSLGREEGQELVKRYGGHVTTAPSSKTSFVVLGNDAGPKKLETIRKLNIKTINEDGLFELIRKLPANGGDSKAALKNEQKKQKEEAKIREMTAEMEREERRLDRAGGAGTGTSRKPAASGTGANSDSRLWTVKYAPSAMNQICGNKTQVEKLQRWLREWPKNQRLGFRMAGKDGSFNFRAVIIHGPPGIGKTTAAHLVAKMEGYDILESNASDTRSKKLVETGLRGVLDNTSLLGYFAGDERKVDATKKKLVLIMDEVDGMSAGDRGGVGALAQVCKKTKIPMILVCNDRRLPKMKPFDHVTYELPFRRPSANDIRSRIASICFREGLKLPPQVIDALIEGSHSDIRQIINMISQVKLDQEALSFDQSKAMTKAWEKHIILKPWDIASKMLSPGMFGETSNKTLNDKIELYFNDHEFSFLMIQENYLKARPTLASKYSGKEHQLKALELADKAAESISDGDLVDRMIHGSQQQWSLMPVHAVFSAVRPASFMHGNLNGPASFTSWLGNNSKQGKLMRFIKEIQGHMRLRASGDRHEIRQQYFPTLWLQLVNKLQTEGKEAVPEVIELMDSYFLTKDDFDAILELGVGPMDMEAVNIGTQSKATFTRLYNQHSHPLPFMKASSVLAPKKASKEKPDLEEAIDDSDEGEDPMADKDVKEEEEEDVDLSKDKYVKQAKKKAGGKKAPAKKTAASKAAKTRNESEDDDLEGSEDLQPKKGRGAKAKGKGKSQENSVSDLIGHPSVTADHNIMIPAIMEASQNRGNRPRWSIAKLVRGRFNLLSSTRSLFGFRQHKRSTQMPTPATTTTNIQEHSNHASNIKADARESTEQGVATAVHYQGHWRKASLVTVGSKAATSESQATLPGKKLSPERQRQLARQIENVVRPDEELIRKYLGERALVARKKTSPLGDGFTPIRFPTFADDDSLAPRDAIRASKEDRNGKSLFNLRFIQALRETELGIPTRSIVAREAVARTYQDPPTSNEIVNLLAASATRRRMHIIECRRAENYTPGDALRESLRRLRDLHRASPGPGKSSDVGPKVPSKGGKTIPPVFTDVDTLKVCIQRIDHSKGNPRPSNFWPSALEAGHFAGKQRLEYLNAREAWLARKMARGEGKETLGEEANLDVGLLAPLPARIERWLHGIPAMGSTNELSASVDSASSSAGSTTRSATSTDEDQVASPVSPPIQAVKIMHNGLSTAVSVAIKADTPAIRSMFYVSAEWSPTRLRRFPKYSNLRRCARPESIIGSGGVSAS